MTELKGGDGENVWGGKGASSLCGCRRDYLHTAVKSTNTIRDNLVLRVKTGVT